MSTKAHKNTYQFTTKKELFLIAAAIIAVVGVVTFAQQTHVNAASTVVDAKAISSQKSVAKKTFVFPVGKISYTIPQVSTTPRRTEMCHTTDGTSPITVDKEDYDKVRSSTSMNDCAEDPEAPEPPFDRHIATATKRILSK